MPEFKKPWVRAAKKKKVALIKGMRSASIPVKVISKYLGLSEKTISNYTKVELEGEYLNLEMSLRRIFMEKDFEMMSGLYKNLKKKMPRASFKNLVEFFKVVRTINMPKTVNPNLSQTNIQFTITDGTKKPEEIIGEDKNNDN